MEHIDEKDMNPLKDAFDKIYKDVTIKPRKEVFKFEPTIEEFKNKEFPASIVTVNGSHAGSVLFCVNSEKWFHVEPDTNRKDPDAVKRVSLLKDFHKVVLSLVKHRFPEEYNFEVSK